MKFHSSGKIVQISKWFMQRLCKASANIYEQHLFCTCSHVVCSVWQVFSDMKPQLYNCKPPTQQSYTKKLERLTNPVDDYLAQPLLRSCSWSAAASANITSPSGQVSPVVWWENKIAGSDVRCVRERFPLAESVVCMNALAALRFIRGIRGAFLGSGGAQGKQKHEQHGSNHRG